MLSTNLLAMALHLSGADAKPSPAPSVRSFSSSIKLTVEGRCCHVCTCGCDCRRPTGGPGRSGGPGGPGSSGSREDSSSSLSSTGGFSNRSKPITSQQARTGSESRREPQTLAMRPSANVPRPPSAPGTQSHSASGPLRQQPLHPPTQTQQAVEQAKSSHRQDHFVHSGPSIGRQLHPQGQASTSRPHTVNRPTVSGSSTIQPSSTNQNIRMRSNKGASAHADPSTPVRSGSMGVVPQAPSGPRPPDINPAVIRPSSEAQNIRPGPSQRQSNPAGPSTPIYAQGSTNVVPQAPGRARPNPAVPEPAQRDTPRSPSARIGKFLGLHKNKQKKKDDEGQA